MELQLTNETFDDLLQETDRPVLVDFWAEWCGPCQMLAPELQELAAGTDAFAVGKVNVDEEPELCDRFGISSIPALLLFQNGQEVARTVGYQTAAQLADFVAASLS